MIFSLFSSRNSLSKKAALWAMLAIWAIQFLGCTAWFHQVEINLDEKSTHASSKWNNLQEQRGTSADTGGYPVDVKSEPINETPALSLDACDEPGDEVLLCAAVAKVLTSFVFFYCIALYFPPPSLLCFKRIALTASTSIPVYRLMMTSCCTPNAPPN